MALELAQIIVGFLLCFRALAVLMEHSLVSMAIYTSGLLLWLILQMLLICTLTMRPAIFFRATVMRVMALACVALKTNLQKMRRNLRILSIKNIKLYLLIKQ